MSKSRAGYYFAMCLLQNGEESNTKQILRSVIENCPESVYANKAVEIVKKIDVEFEYNSPCVSYIKAEELFN